MAWIQSPPPQNKKGGKNGRNLEKAHEKAEWELVVRLKW
jgi:hypothetical protein